MADGMCKLMPKGQVLFFKFIICLWTNNLNNNQTSKPAVRLMID